MEAPSLDVNVDQHAPEDGDWASLHEPELRRSNALIIICSPGIKHPVGQNDWTDLDIAWWLEHRDVPPVLVDPLGTGARWVPQSVAERWPEAQAIQIPEGKRDGDPRRSEEKTRQQLIRAILAVGTVRQGHRDYDQNKVQELTKSLDEQRQVSEQLQASLSEQQQTSEKLRASLTQQKQTAVELQSILGVQQSRARHWRVAFGAASLLLAAKLAAGIFVPL